MMTIREDDVPASLVRLAAMQLGDRDLAARWREEWLSSLPPRDQYRRWRYAISLLVRGACATRLSIKFAKPGNSRPLFPAKAMMALCVALFVCASVSCVISTMNNLTNYAGYSWVTANVWFWVCQLCTFTVLCFILVGMSYRHRAARWMAVAGMIFSQIQSLSGITFLQAESPPLLMYGHAATVSLPPGYFWDLFYPTEQAWCLGAMFGALTIIVAYKIPRSVRAFSSVSLCALLCLSSLSGSLPDSTIGVFWIKVSSWISFPRGTRVIIHLSGNFQIDLSATLDRLIWSTQVLILAGLVVAVVRVGTLIVCMLRVSTGRCSGDKSITQRVQSHLMEK